MISWNLPPEFDPGFYRNRYGELAGMSDDQLVLHYNTHGKYQGLQATAIAERSDFVALIPPTASTLEIGPFAAPVCQGPAVRYSDILDTAALKARAVPHGMDPARVPTIHYPLGDGTLDDIPEQFDAVVTSHVVEHQPDFITHLQQVERRLNGHGKYFVLVPDKRFCFDNRIAPSTIAELLQAHAEKRKVHTLRSVIEHRALVVHSDPARHWAERHRPADADAVDVFKVREAMDEYAAADGGYIDVHAWYFTPDSFRAIMDNLFDLELTSLRVERLYRTRRDRLEFWAVLTRGEPSVCLSDLATQGPEVDMVTETALTAAAPVGHGAASDPVAPAVGMVGRLLRGIAGR